MSYRVGDVRYNRELRCEKRGGTTEKYHVERRETQRRTTMYKERGARRITMWDRGGTTENYHVEKGRDNGELPC